MREGLLGLWCIIGYSSSNFRLLQLQSLRCFGRGRGLSGRTTANWRWILSKKRLQKLQFSSPSISPHLRFKSFLMSMHQRWLDGELFYLNFRATGIFILRGLKVEYGLMQRENTTH